MSEDRKNLPLVKLTGMYENQSQRTGATYFAGYLGTAKVLLLKDSKAEPGQPGWSLMIQEREHKATNGQGVTAQQAGPSPRQGYNAGSNRPEPPWTSDADIPF